MKNYEAKVRLSANSKEIAEDMLDNMLAGADDFPLQIEGIEWGDGQGFFMRFDLVEITEGETT